MANISKGHFSNAGQVISGTFNNHGVSLAGTIHGNVYIGLFSLGNWLALICRD
jgi:hypothetical protein